MNHITKIVSAIALFAATTATAQEAIFIQQNLTSPELATDGSVTFRIYAPMAHNVEVHGNFAASPLSMAADSIGVWSATTTVVPELYSYAFVVDGVRTLDPSNVHVVRDVSTLSNILLYPGTDTDAARNYAVGDVPHGTVRKIWYQSPELGFERRLTVYTPAGYEASDEQYPVLYLLHGMGGDEDAWTSLGRTAEILDNLIAAGKARPMIVVMPNGNAARQAAPGQAADNLAQPQFYLPKTMDGSYEAAFPEIVSFVDSQFRTIPQKSARAIAGLSMGGFHSMQISKEYPDTFDFIGLFSAAITRGNPDDTPVYRDFDAKLRRQFDAAPALYYIAIGTDDFLYDDNVAYRAKLDAMGAQYVYNESAEGHIWRNWRKYLLDFLPRLF